jgi:CheY-like chemotaxis protein
MRLNNPELQNPNDTLYSTERAIPEAVMQRARRALNEMSSDIVSLRMLVIAEAPLQQKLWQQAAGQASVPVDYDAAGDAAGAVETLKGSAIDICIIDATISGADRRKVIEAARAARSAPLVFAAIMRGGRRPDDVDGALARPDLPEDAEKLVEICVRARVPTRVLVVDNSATTRGIVRKILTASRFTLDIHDASESAAALEQLRSGNFALAFVDDNMPGFNGFEILFEIRRIAPKTSVVMMTSTADDAVVYRAQASGALALLKKPFYPKDIDAVFERYFGLGGWID